jgi:hypothetical protein
MLKKLFDASIVIFLGTLAALFYYDSSYYPGHTQLLGGFEQTLVCLGILAAIFIWWVIYFSVTKDFRRMRIPAIILLSLAAFFGFIFLKEQIKNFIDNRNHSAWLARTNNAHFDSSKLGISFSYVSESEFEGAVTVEEKNNVIRLLLSKNPDGAGTIEVFQKDSSLGLVEFLAKKYSKKYPDCELAPDVWTFPKKYEVVVSNVPNNNNECPFLIPGGNDPQYFIMDKKIPDKYILLTVQHYSYIEAYKPTHKDENVPQWFETIIFSKK